MARDLVSVEKYEGRKSYQKFVEDMLEAELEPFHYQGRYFYEGPAVVVDYPEEAKEATKVGCRVDNMGLGYVVYPG